MDKPTVEGEPKEESKRSKREKKRAAAAARLARASLHPAADDRGVPKGRRVRVKGGPRARRPPNKQGPQCGEPAADHEGPKIRDARNPRLMMAVCRGHQDCECISQVCSG